MKQDGGLRWLFRTRLPRAQWTSVETGGTASGVPDCEYCFPGGAQGWVEMKLTRAWAVRFAPAQVAWVGRRARLGGRITLAVRRINGIEDQLWLVEGALIGVLREEGLKDCALLGQWTGGPAKWPWDRVGEILRRNPNVYKRTNQ
jgi:hypothetical protein